MPLVSGTWCGKLFHSPPYEHPNTSCYRQLSRGKRENSLTHLQELRGINGLRYVREMSQNTDNGG